MKCTYQCFRRRTITRKTTTAVTIMIISTSFGPISTAAIVIISLFIIELIYIRAKVFQMFPLAETF